jgi:hypothetical protein
MTTMRIAAIVVSVAMACISLKKVAVHIYDQVWLSRIQKVGPSDTALSTNNRVSSLRPSAGGSKALSSADVGRGPEYVGVTGAALTLDTTSPVRNKKIAAIASSAPPSQIDGPRGSRDHDTNRHGRGVSLQGFLLSLWSNNQFMLMCLAVVSSFNTIAIGVYDSVPTELSKRTIDKTFDGRYTKFQIFFQPALVFQIPVAAEYIFYKTTWMNNNYFQARSNSSILPKPVVEKSQSALRMYVSCWIPCCFLAAIYLDDASAGRSNRGYSTSVKYGLWSCYGITIALLIIVLWQQIYRQCLPLLAALETLKKALEGKTGPDAEARRGSITNAIRLQTYVLKFMTATFPGMIAMHLSYLIPVSMLYQHYFTWAALFAGQSFSLFIVVMISIPKYS